MVSQISVELLEREDRHRHCHQQQGRGDLGDGNVTEHLQQVGAVDLCCFVGSRAGMACAAPRGSTGSCERKRLPDRQRNDQRSIASFRVGQPAFRVVFDAGNKPGEDVHHPEGRDCTSTGRPERPRLPREGPGTAMRSAPGCGRGTCGSATKRRAAPSDTAPTTTKAM